MAKNRVIVLSVIESGLRPADAARRYGVSRRWVEILLARYRAGGFDALEPRSRAPRHHPNATPPHLVQRILDLRHELETTGQDAGAMTIAMRLEREGLPGPSRATIHRTLRANALITPQPRKRPRSSWHLFAADQPNEMWQADFTHWPLADGTDTEILDFLDDHSRYLLTARAFTPVTGPIVTATFLDLTRIYGPPAVMLTDNGMVFTTRFAQGARVLKTLNSFERALADLDIRQLNGAPNHPQTQGKIERFHQTLKRWLTAQPPAPDIEALQEQLNTFQTWYNTQRPHRALNRHTPAEAYEALPKAHPAPHSRPGGYTIRTDRVDQDGKVSLRHAGRMRHLGIGRAHTSRPVRLLIDHDDVLVTDLDTGTILAEFTIDTTRGYQPKKKGPGENRGPSS
ncbi:IS481 family transposase [Brachybacterium sp. YJGR34]|uniref:IS481 family transposase n=1 Tax=Brachybacterium sp. YJGR34 TaxID=2059911 RepID=UPI000E0B1311|nr:IS481 family transposase [Brachybacterium sp. YJGR34]